MPSIASCYDLEFEAKVVHSDPLKKNIVLDRTAFYPEGGGQPSDTGEISWNGETSKVVFVKRSDEIRHFLEGDGTPPADTMVRCRVDEKKRYAHMRMHTSQHLISAIAWKLFHARTVGNQIHMEMSHLDLRPAKLTDEDLYRITDGFDRLVSDGHEVYLAELDIDRIKASIGTERVDLSRLPKNISRLRTVIIGKDGCIDLCPCAGTHVRSLSELKGLGSITRRSKGSDTTRLEYTLL